MKVNSNKMWIICACTLMGLVFAACTPATGDLTGPGEELGPERETPPTEVSLENTSWRLVSFESAGTETPALAGAQVTLEFGEAGRAGGSGGCNSFGAQVKIGAGTLSFGPIESTLMACIDPGVMEQEQRYYTALDSAGKYELAGDQLKIQHNDGQEALNFVRAQPGETPEATPEAENPLANTKWRLESFGPAGSPEPVLGEAALTLEFDGAGQAGGYGGCNSYGASFQVQEDVLSFGVINSTLRACADENLNQQEQRYLRALQTAGRFELDPERLVIEYDGGQGVFNFVRNNGG